MKTITVKYFGAIAEQVGTTEETIELPKKGMPASDLKAFLIKKYNLRNRETLQVAVNSELNSAAAVNEGDEVALLPPFAGG